MRHTDTIAVTGTVGTEPRLRAGDSGLEITSFRLATNHDRFNRETGQWEQQPANWYTVSAYRSLAGNVAASVTKGDRVVVTGRLKISRWESGDKRGTSVEIDADSIGLDLTFARAARPASARRASGDGADGPSGPEPAGSGGTAAASGIFPPSQPGGDGFLPGAQRTHGPPRERSAA